MGHDKKRKRDKDSSSKHKSKRKKTSESLMGYSNVDNPFGDTNLTNRFVWHKKIEQDQEKGKISSSSMHHSAKEEKKRLKKIQQELEKAKQRREEREREKQIWEEEMARIERERNKLQWDDWESKEITFHLQQAKNRAILRIKEGRPTPIDWIYQWVTLGLYPEKEELEKLKSFPLCNPIYQIPQVSQAELIDLESDLDIIKRVLMYNLKAKQSSNEKDEIITSTALPETLLVLVQHELQKKRSQQKDSTVVTLDKAQLDKVDSLLHNKSSEDLEKLQDEIKKLLNSGGAVDVGFWETVLKESHLAKARAKVLEVHKQLLARRYELFQIDPNDDTPTNPLFKSYVPDAEPTLDLSPSAVSDTNANANANVNDDLINQEQISTITDKKLTTEEKTILLEQNRAKLLEQNALKLCERSKVNLDDNTFTTEDLMLKRETDKGLAQNEEVFQSEVQIDKKYDWYDQYRPRKPKYFNRVKTGYEWNRYNQTHYDHDNPPPKIIQGYKFNIFYPDLINPRDEPTYFLERSDEDTTIIRFHAGPPYEDIAFRIVNREWERSHRKGYKCCFEKGVLQLWFNFKRYRYRR